MAQWLVRSVQNTARSLWLSAGVADSATTTAAVSAGQSTRPPDGQRQRNERLWANMLGVHRAQGASLLAPWLLLSVESNRDAGTVS